MENIDYHHAASPIATDEPVMTFTRHTKTRGDFVTVVTVSQVRRIITVVLIGLAAFVGINLASDFDRYRNNDLLRPQMEQLADEDKDLAALWLIRHYPDQNLQRIPALVDKGNFEAMWMQAGLFERDGKKDASIKIYQALAKEGDARSIAYLKRKGIKP